MKHRGKLHFGAYFKALFEILVLFEEGGIVDYDLGICYP